MTLVQCTLVMSVVASLESMDTRLGEALVMAQLEMVLRWEALVMARLELVPH